MVSIAQLDLTAYYQCQANLNLYDAAELNGLATQAVAGRQLRLVSLPLNEAEEVAGVAMQVRLCEDDYPGWVALEDIDLLAIADEPYQPLLLSEVEIRARLPKVLDFIYVAMNQPNRYLWGGTVGPNYDCSGLTQTAFASVGIWLPRDAYQQEAFVQPIAIADVEPGDLIFFGQPERCTHVAIALSNEHYLHSSGKDQGRNGIGIDRISADGDVVSQTYYQQLRGAGRVVAGYVPTNDCFSIRRT
jgi:NlpC/P60 family/Bacterial dipeptidyl-peptidase Sh3 domain